MTMRKIRLLKPMATFGQTGIPVMRRVGSLIEVDEKTAVRMVASLIGIDVTASQSPPPGLQEDAPEPVNAPVQNGRTSRKSGKPDDGKVAPAD